RMHPIATARALSRRTGTTLAAFPAATMPSIIEMPVTEPQSATFADDTAIASRLRTALRPFALRHRRLATVAPNLAIPAGAYVCAGGLRFDFTIPRDLEPIFLTTLGVVVACKLVAFWATGLYAGWWRHVSIRDVDSIVRGNVIGSLLFLCLMVFGIGLDGFP